MLRVKRLLELSKGHTSRSLRKGDLPQALYFRVTHRISFGSQSVGKKNNEHGQGGDNLPSEDETITDQVFKHECVKPPASLRKRVRAHASGESIFISPDISVYIHFSGHDDPNPS